MLHCWPFSHALIGGLYGLRGDLVCPGALCRSRDLFQTFERVDRGIAPNSTMMTVAVDPRAPAHVYCNSRDGQVFASLDDGATWTTYQLPEKAKEMRALAAG